MASTRTSKRSEDAATLKPLLVKQHDAILRCLHALNARLSRHEQLLEDILRKGPPPAGPIGMITPPSDDGSWTSAVLNPVFFNSNGGLSTRGDINPAALNSSGANSIGNEKRETVGLTVGWKDSTQTFSDSDSVEVLEVGLKVNGRPLSDIPDTSIQDSTCSDAAGRYISGDTVRQVMSVQTVGKRRGSTFSNELFADEALDRAVATNYGRMSSKFTEERYDGALMKLLKKVVKSTRFDLAISLLVVSNAIAIGVEADYVASYMLTSSPLGFRMLGWIYASIFLVELMARLFVDRWEFFRSSNSAWNILDTIIVFASVIEVIIDLFFSSLKSASSNAMILRTGRLIRTLRLLRTIRITSLIRYISALQTLIHLIFATLKSLVWAIVLMIMIVYIFGIWFTQASTSKRLETSPEEQDDDLILYWGGLGPSMFTLYKSVTGGISWHDVTLPLARIHWIWVFLFTAYVSFTYFAVLNVVTGVFCNSAFETAKRNPEVVVQSMVADQKWFEKHLTEMYQKFKADDSGNVSLRELEKHMKDESVQACFVAIGLEISDAWALFQLIDTDGTCGISELEFVQGCMQLSGSAKNVDIATMRYEIKNMFKKTAKLIRHLQVDVHNCAHSIHELRTSRLPAVQFPQLISQRTTSSQGMDLVSPRDMPSSQRAALLGQRSLSSQGYDIPSPPETPGGQKERKFEGNSSPTTPSSIRRI